VNQTEETIHESVKGFYGKIAASSTSGCGCGCGPTNLLYDEQLLTDIPENVANFTLGSGDPVSVANLQPGEIVLDLGSGGGLDCFIAAKQVGDEGRVIGVDMTPEMLARAQSEAQRLGISNVEFRPGYLEALPVENESIDVVISNCVINLSPDKSQVFSEIFRVLKPGGRLSISDVIARGELPEHIKNDIQNWNACGAGAIPKDVYEEALREAGFVEVEISPKTYQGPVPDNVPDEAGSLFSSAKITARKP
jgi:SAM-dependent methyltransferase